MLVVTKSALLDWDKGLPFEKITIFNLKYSLYHTALRVDIVKYVDGQETKILKDNGRK
jgi:hypothetical protein